MNSGNDLSAIVESSIDYDETARLANAAFGGSESFTPCVLRWLYERSFSRGSKVVALYKNGRKVGQFVMLRQDISCGGEIVNGVQLIDLFIAKEFRSRTSLTMLYDAVRDQCIAESIRFAIGMPNEKAIGANEHFLGLKRYLRLDIRAGISVLLPFRELLINQRVKASDSSELLCRLSSFFPSPRSADGIAWSPETLLNRLGHPDRAYGLHATSDILLVSSPRRRKGIPYTLLCGLFVAGRRPPKKADLRAVVRAACRLTGHPLYIFPGMHAIAPLPGLTLPGWARPSTMLVQLRDFQPELRHLHLESFQPLDFDFA